MAGRRRTGALPWFPSSCSQPASWRSTFVKGWSPALGLDLQGGASVVYQAANEVPDEALDDAISIIRSWVDALGVAEPEIVAPGRLHRRQPPRRHGSRPGPRRHRPHRRAAVPAGARHLLRTSTEEQYNEALRRPRRAPRHGPGRDHHDAAGRHQHARPPPRPAGDTTSTSEGAVGAPAGRPAWPKASSPAYCCRPPRPGPDGHHRHHAHRRHRHRRRRPQHPSTTVIDATEDTSRSRRAATPFTTRASPSTPPRRPTGDTADATVVLPGAEDSQRRRQPRLLLPARPGAHPRRPRAAGLGGLGPEAQINRGHWGVSLNIQGDDLPLFSQLPPSATARTRRPAPPACSGIVPRRRGAVGPERPASPASTVNGLSISGSFTEREARDFA